MIATTWTNFLNKGKKRNIPYDKKNYCAVEWMTFSSSQNNKTQISTFSWESLFPNMFIAKQKLTTGLSSTLKLLDHFFAFPLYVYEKTLKPWFSFSGNFTIKCRYVDNSFGCLEN